MTDVLIKRGNLDRETNMLRGKTMWRDTGRAPFENKSYGATSQGMAGLPEAGRGRILPQQVSEGLWPFKNLDEGC